MYDGIPAALDQAAKDPSVRVAVTTGAGDYYCSGNDLSNFRNAPMEGPEKLAEVATGKIRLTNPPCKWHFLVLKTVEHDMW